MVLAGALAALVPTVGDFGLTWDEPAYRYSQVMSAQWWEQLGQARSVQRRSASCSIRSHLLYFWPYGRFGINFHPPLAGQLNLATYAVFGHWMKDIPARRMASVIEFALTITIGFHFLARRYGVWVGAVDGRLAPVHAPALRAGALDRYRHAGALALVGDRPGVLERTARAARPAMAGRRRHLGRAGLRRERWPRSWCLLPLLLWLVVGHLPRTSHTPRRTFRLDRRARHVGRDAGSAMAGVSADLRCCSNGCPCPAKTDFFIHRPSSDLPGSDPGGSACRSGASGAFSAGASQEHAIWGVERPALETWTAILAFAPVIAWLGNPAWWRETLPRLAHYYTLSRDRENVLPKIQIIYFGQIYEFSLPWHNGWVLLGDHRADRRFSRPVSIGLVWGIGQFRRDRFPVLLSGPLPDLAGDPDASRPRPTTESGCSCRHSSFWRPLRAGARSGLADALVASDSDSPTGCRGRS